MVVPEQESARSRVVLALQGAQRKSMGSQRPKMAFLAVFVALKIAHRAGGYAVWSWIPTICDLRRSGCHLVQLKNPVKRLFLGHILIYSRFRVRHDAGVLGPNGRYEQNRNGAKTPKTGVFWDLFGDPRLKKLRPRVQVGYQLVARYGHFVRTVAHLSTGRSSLHAHCPLRLVACASE